MLLKQTITSLEETDPALDQAQLFAMGLDDIRRFSWRQWTDHNTHDPGITILELLCYTLTDLSYRAQYPLEDLLATPTDNAENMAKQFFTAGEVLPSQPLTAIDYRKLLIDLPGVRNAWVSPAPLQYFADIVAKKLRLEGPTSKTVRPVDVRGLYRVRIEYADDKKTNDEQEKVNAAALELLQANRNLCEDFVAVEGVQTQPYSLCAELELRPDANPIEIAAQMRFQVDQYLSPQILNYTLDEMQRKRHADGLAYTLDEIFEGPQLTNGFLDTEEVAKAELRIDVRLSDIINVIMDIDGVLAVRDIIVNQLRIEVETKADGTRVEKVTAIEPQNKWRLVVPAGKQPRLADQHGRFVFYKRNLPTQPDQEKVRTRYEELKKNQRPRLKEMGRKDVPIPLGRERNVASYFSFQHHFPDVYGLSEVGLPANAGDLRRAQSLQLKGYLLFFDQVLANYLKQLSQVSKLFSRDPKTAIRSYFAQKVRSFPDYEKIYSAEVADDSKLPPLESETEANVRRNSFLDHLLARIAEDFHHYVSIQHTTFGATEQSAIDTKCAFLNDFPKLGRERGLAYDYSLKKPEEQWDSVKVSGLERRLARLLGISDFSRRNLSAHPTENAGEGMYLIENVLLRPETAVDPVLPVCVDPACTDCADDDPYSYRLHFVLPSYAGRFQNMDFRRYVEETIRLETPAHILPKICWVDSDQMANFEPLYHDWISLRAGIFEGNREKLLEAFCEALFALKNVYPKQHLSDCSSGNKEPPFVLGRTQLGKPK